MGLYQVRILPYIVREVSDLQVSKMRSNGTDRKRGRVMGIRQDQCNKVCRIIDDYLANRPRERDELIVAVRTAFKEADRKTEPQTSGIPYKIETSSVCKDEPQTKELQDWKDRMWAEAVIASQTEREGE